MENRMSLLLMLLNLAALALGQETVPCLTTRDECSIGASVSVINDNYYCCVAGYSMSWTNEGCSCRQTSQVVPCATGPQACRNANSVSSDGNGNTRCCQNGYSMSSNSGFVDGQFISTCTCTRPLGGGGAGGIMLNNGIGNMFSGNFSNFNQTEFGSRMSQWGQSLANQMMSVSNNLQQNLGNMFRNLGIFG